jgi:hypothetical protein
MSRRRSDDTPLPAPLPFLGPTGEQSGRIQLDWISKTEATAAWRDSPRRLGPLIFCVVLLAALHLPEPSLSRAYEQAAPAAGGLAHAGLATLRDAYGRALPVARRAVAVAATAKDSVADAAGRLCQRITN